MGSTNKYATRGTDNIFPGRMPFTFPMMSLPQHHEVLAATNSGPYVSPVYIINFHTYKQEVEDTVLSKGAVFLSLSTNAQESLPGPSRQPIRHPLPQPKLRALNSSLSHDQCVHKSFLFLELEFSKNDALEATKKGSERLAQQFATVNKWRVCGELGAMRVWRFPYRSERRVAGGGGG